MSSREDDVQVEGPGFQPSNYRAEPVTQGVALAWD